MQFTVEKTAKAKTLKDSVSIPNSLYTSKIFGTDNEIDKCYQMNNTQGSTLVEMWNQQHPLMNTWLVLSSISICFLSALLFIIS